MHKVVNYYKDTKKLQSYLNEIDTELLIDIYIQNFAEKKINDGEKIQIEVNNITGTTIYKTEKGYKSSKLDRLFTDFCNFLLTHNESVETFIMLNK